MMTVTRAALAPSLSVRLSSKVCSSSAITRSSPPPQQRPGLLTRETRRTLGLGSKTSFPSGELIDRRDKRNLNQKVLSIRIQIKTPRITAGRAQGDCGTMLLNSDSFSEGG